ncbi:cysteine proteinase [Cylindrobasidium torrendii FP15055 ss-10]|uniref:ubiquitinyl hydrolase 1 n=1 Tax=Cylindrobasidium torrendii FP15055 ss-10 TaxID=1314674 RepID=A0A0D7AUB1_9AGAR|nr:cysteine proteinase [Cylindrobasidium torrendii FP15055 ss-10]
MYFEGAYGGIKFHTGVFTALTRKLGISGLDFVELYDIEPSAVDHLRPHGLICCFLWRKDAPSRPARPTDGASKDADELGPESVWFANQLSDDACASQAILNVLFNCPDVRLGSEMTFFKEETKGMSPVMRGLAITNSPSIRGAHNSLARPADLRGAKNAITDTTMLAAKKAKNTKPPPNKKAKTTTAAKKKEETEDEDTYHFIGYTPAHGRVWELDGLKSGPLEVGELRADTDGTWMDVVRPALRTKMRKYGHIQFSLLAIVDSTYERLSDDWEYWKRERRSLERRLDPGWQDLVNPVLRDTAASLFSEDVRSTFSSDFGDRRMRRDTTIFGMDQEALRRAWEEAVQKGMQAQEDVQQELSKASEQHTEHIKRTHDYEPFFVQFITQLHEQGHLSGLLKRKS